jgi:hypothetical protein
MPQLGVVGEVADEADGCLGHGPAPSCCLAGRSALPWSRGTVGRAGCTVTTARGGASEVGHGSGCRAGSALGGRVVGGSACRRVGLPAPSGQLPPPGRGGRTRLPPQGRLLPVPGADAVSSGGSRRPWRRRGPCHPASVARPGR